MMEDFTLSRQSFEDSKRLIINVFVAVPCSELQLEQFELADLADPADLRRVSWPQYHSSPGELDSFHSPAFY